MGESLHHPKVLACDLDDTLALTNVAVAAWHNSQYGTSMTLDDFYYYHYWKNQDWGTAEETMNKLDKFYRSESWLNLNPVPGAKETLEKLVSKGYLISIVTARGINQKDVTEGFLAKWFPGLIDKVHYTGEFVGDKYGGECKMSKYEICQSISAVALIDDCLNNVIPCSVGKPPIPTVLFGNYEWNKRLSPIASELDRMSYEQRLLVEKKPGWWKQDELDELPMFIKHCISWELVESVLDDIEKMRTVVE